jgi:CheY-like chemotaxis protein
MEEMLRRTLGSSIKVATVLEPDLWAALVDPTQIDLVILNLAINARDAMPHGGTLRLETRNVKARLLDRSVGAAPGDYVCLSVTDTGIGMTEDVLARACEPFYTTKGTGMGTGLGLAQVYGLARQSNGGLRIRSTPGQGTTVEIYLPRSATASDTAASVLLDGGSSHASNIGYAGTVLVVDDQDDVREVAVGLLATLGYRTVQAGTGSAALDLLGRDSTVAVLLADYTMPGMTGIDLARAARAKHPDLPVVIVTGYANITGLDGQIADAVFLRKPYQREELVAAIEQAGQRASQRKAGRVVPLPVAFRAPALR